MDPVIEIRYIAIISLTIATLIMSSVVRKFGKSSLGSIFSYFFVGTAIYLGTLIFRQFGSQTFGISAVTAEIYSYLLLYLSLIFFFISLKLLVGMGKAQSEGRIVEYGSEKTWSSVGLVVMFVIFIMARKLSYVVALYISSNLYAYGFHNFVASALAGMVGIYLITAKKTIGKIGHSISTPMSTAIWIIAINQFWKLFVNNWSVYSISPQTGMIVAVCFSVLTSLAILYATIRLKKFTSA